MNHTKRIIDQKLAYVTLLVDDYDEAIAFYRDKLNFRLIEDSNLSETKRWVLIAPPGISEFCLLLAKAANETQKAQVGNQSGGRVFLFLFTDDFESDYENLIQQKIKIVRQPQHESYGKVAVFADLYGNLWDLIEPEK